MIGKLAETYARVLASGSGMEIFASELEAYAFASCSPSYQRMIPYCIANIGNFRGNSSVSLLHGMVRSVPTATLLRRFIDIDIKRHDSVDLMEDLCNSVGVEYRFIQSDSVQACIPIVDLLFIDSLHIGSHLRKELDRFHCMVGKYIIVHDTEFCKAFGVHPARKGMCAGEGLAPVILRFLDENKYEWKIDKHIDRGVGLTVLSRRGIGDAV